MSTEFRYHNSESICHTCGAMVPNSGTDRQRHAEWHQTLTGWQNAIDKALDTAPPASGDFGPFPFQCSICFGPVDADGETCGTCADLANEGVL